MTNDLGPTNAGDTILRYLRPKRFICARGVVNLLAWTGSGSSKRIGALALQTLGELTTHHLSAWSLRFVARLRADEVETTGARLLRRSGHAIGKPKEPP